MFGLVKSGHCQPIMFLIIKTIGSAKISFKIAYFLSIEPYQNRIFLRACFAVMSSWRAMFSINLQNELHDAVFL